MSMAWIKMLLEVTCFTLLNFFAYRTLIPHIIAVSDLPIEAAYFYSVGAFVLVPMFLWTAWNLSRNGEGIAIKRILINARVTKLSGKDWFWTIGTFLGLSMASALIAKVLMPKLGMDATPFFFQNMPLSPDMLWLLYWWPLFFFFNIFGEELFWRGYILPRQEQLNSKYAWAFNGFLWLVWHLPMGLDLVLAALPTIFILPAISQLRKTTTIAIIVHALFGAFGFLVLAFGLIH